MIQIPTNIILKFDSLVSSSWYTVHSMIRDKRIYKFHSFLKSSTIFVSHTHTLCEYNTKNNKVYNSIHIEF